MLLSFSVCVCAQSLSCVQLFATTWTAACQAPLSRQEYWSGLPCCPPGDPINPGIEPRSPTLQVDSLLSEPPEEPKNTSVDNLSLLQGIFPAQELNQGVLHHRWILHQLSYQGGCFYCTGCWWECKLIAVIMENSMEVP